MDAGTAIEHTAVLQLRGRTFGPPLIKRIYLPTPLTGSRRASDMQKGDAQKQRVRDLKAGDRVESYFSVGYTKPVTEYKYGFMFEFRAVDRSGQITAKYWGGDDEKAVKALHDSFKKGDVVSLRGEVSDYRGALEVSVSAKNGGTIEKLAEGQYSLTELVDTVDNIDELRTRLLGFMDAVEEPHLRRLLDSFFADEEFLKAFCLAPASIQLHSAAFGGLLKHTVSVVSICGQVLKLHPELDRDLVIAGALLHDIGKVQGFRVTTHIDQTTEGNLVGHIILGDQEFLEHVSKIEGFPEDLATKLRHIMLAHHGRKEWGSPIDPMMPEALAVHEADDLDAKLDYMIAKRRDAVTEDDWIWDSRLGRLIYLK